MSVEVIDIQTLLPFDLPGTIKDSIAKTAAAIFVDEDVEGGASAFMMQQVIDKQGGFDLLDARPRCLTAKDHRSPYGSDGDYFTKPNTEQVIETVFSVLSEREPRRFGHLL